MIILTIFLMLCLAVPAGSQMAFEDQLDELKVEKISDSIIIVKTVAGYPNQLAINSDQGIIVLGTHWNPKTASEFRHVIEEEFGSEKFRYIIDITSRIISNGGTDAYPGVENLAHESCREIMLARASRLQEDIDQEIEVFRWKENHSRTILEETPDSPDADQGQYNWMMFCKRLADDLESDGYKQKLPDITFKDRKSIDLGHGTLELIDFGKGTDSNSLMIWLPQDGFLMAPAFGPHHMSPILRDFSDDKTVEKWLAVLDELLDGEHEIKQVYCGLQGDLTVDQLAKRRDYIRALWNGVVKATEEGLDYTTATERLAVENLVPDIKTWPIWENHKEGWVYEDHGEHLYSYWMLLHESAAQVIEQTLDDAGIKKALSKFEEILKDKSHSYFVSEQWFNSLGYRLLNEDRIAEAIAVFQMNVKAYPGSANVYDSLAEAYMTNGQNELAINNYKKSLELNPANANAVEMLEKLEKL